jgi:hypothetical protein
MRPSYQRLRVDGRRHWRTHVGRYRMDHAAVPLAYDVHPDFGYFCAGPRVRRELRVALVSMLFGMAIGAAIVTIRAGQASETDGVSSNARLKPSGTNTSALLVTGPNLQFKNVDEARVQPVEAIKPFPMRMVRVRPSKAASPIAGILLGRRARTVIREPLADV